MTNESKIKLLELAAREYLDGELSINEYVNINITVLSLVEPTEEDIKRAKEYIDKELFPNDVKALTHGGKVVRKT